MALIVGEGKTKFTKVSRLESNLVIINSINKIKTNRYTFIRVDSFKYLGTHNWQQTCIKRYTNNRQRQSSLFHSSKRQKYLNQQLLSRWSKVKSYKEYNTILNLWTRLVGYDEKLSKEKNWEEYMATIQQYEFQHNGDSKSLFRHSNVAAFVKSKRTQWLGHVWRVGGRVQKEAKWKKY